MVVYPHGCALLILFKPEQFAKGISEKKREAGNFCPTYQWKSPGQNSGLNQQLMMVKGIINLCAIIKESLFSLSSNISSALSFFKLTFLNV